MVIKIQTADSSHGHNAINYAMNKKADDGRKPEFISSANMPWDNIFGDSISLNNCIEFPLRQVLTPES